MKRIVFVLAVGSAAMLLMILRFPGNSARIRQFFGTEASVPVQAPIKPPDPPKKAGHSKAAPGQAAAKKVAAPDAVTVGASSVPVPPELQDHKEAVAKRTLGLASTRGEDVPVYSNNSGGANVLRRLPKGTPVQFDLEALTAGERWTLIQVKDGGLSGFVRTEDLVIQQLHADGPQ